MIDTNELEFISDVKDVLASLAPEVQQRNAYMNRRDWYTYGDGLWENLEVEDGFDRTLYNFLPRVVDIHTSQLMGRPFQVYSYWEKDDVSLFSEQDPALGAAVLTNKRKKADADSRKRFVDAIIRDNGGYEIFKQGARLGSVYGLTVYKMWWSDEERKICISLLESPQNYYAGWNSNDFRKRDFDAYVYDISYSDAMRMYGDKLPKDEDFEMSTDQMGVSSNSSTSDPLDQITSGANLVAQTNRQMVKVIDITGYLDKWGVEGKKVVPVEQGKEKKFSRLIVGGHVVQTITDESKLPKYYTINNRQIPRRAYGESDLPDSALEINATYVERMSDYITLVNKTLFPMIMAKGFEQGSVPKKRQRKMTVSAMGNDQTLEVLNLPNNFGFDYGKILEELKDSFVRVTGISRVLFDDPSVNTDSNQALITTLKGVIDIVEDKQSRWEPALAEMFTDALKLSAKYVPAIKDSIPEDEYWFLYIKWSSVLRKEDASYQQMYLNRMTAGTISLDSYLEAMGTDDVSEEIDRIRDNYQDPVIAAILGNVRQMLAQQTLAEGNPILMAQQAQQLQAGQTAPGQPSNPQLTPDQNGGQSASIPGSGAPTGVSPQGAINMNAQNQGY